MKRIVTIDLISSLLIFLFGYTAISKLLSIHRFEAMPLISSGAPLLAWQVPLAELCMVGLLIFPLTRRLGLIASAAMLSLFTMYLVYMILLTPHLPCTCGGVISNMSWREHIAFNGVFIGLTAWGIRKCRKEAWSLKNT